MDLIPLVVSLISLFAVLLLMKRQREFNGAALRQLRAMDKRFDDSETTVNNLVSRLSLIIRMLRQHMKDGEILVQVGTANDRKLINALQAAGIYVQFDEFPQTELGRSKVIAEMLHGEEA